MQRTMLARRRLCVRRCAHSEGEGERWRGRGQRVESGGGIAQPQWLDVDECGVGLMRPDGLLERAHVVGGDHDADLDQTIICADERRVLVVAECAADRQPLFVVCDARSAAQCERGAQSRLVRRVGEA
jgi:hypothetical protein